MSSCRILAVLLLALTTHAAAAPRSIAAFCTAPELPNPHCGLVDATGNFLVEPQPGPVFVRNPGFAEVHRTQGVGVVDAKGEVIVPIKFDKIIIPDQGEPTRAYALEGKTLTVFDLVTRKPVRSFPYTGAFNTSLGLEPAVQIGRLISRDGSFSPESTLDLHTDETVFRIADDLLYYKEEEGLGPAKIRLVDLQKLKVIETPWLRVDYARGLLVGWRWPSGFNPLGGRAGGDARAVPDHSATVIDRDGRAVGQEYPWLAPLDAGHALVRKDGRYVPIVVPEHRHATGRAWVMPGADEHGPLSKIWEGAAQGYAARDGRIVLEPAFDYVDEFPVYGLYGVGKITGVEDGDEQTVHGAFDAQGRYVIPLKYEAFFDAGDARSGLLSAELDGQCGYLDAQGKARIPLKYSVCAGFRNGYAEVCTPAGCSLMNVEERFVVPPDYHYKVETNDGKLFSIKRSSDNGAAWIVDGAGRTVVRRAEVCGKVVAVDSGQRIVWPRGHVPGCKQPQPKFLPREKAE